MRHEGAPHDALRSTVGTAAGLTVRDDGGGKPVFQKWSPYDARSRSSVTPPVRETGSVATPLAADLENALEPTL
jgi:hypothetical protein